MALIENLEQDNWQELLRMFFIATLDILKTDPYSSVGSAVDDLRAWLRTGGVHRVRENLDKQMQARGFSDDKRKDVMGFLDVLLQENRLQLVELAGQTELPAKEQEILQTLHPRGSQKTPWHPTAAPWQGDLIPQKMLFVFNRLACPTGPFAPIPVQTRLCNPMRSPVQPFQNFRFA